MVLSAKQKKVFNIVLVVAFVAIILSGIGLGIYFICKDKTELSARQKSFVNAVNLNNSKQEQSEIDVSLLPAAVSKQNIVKCTSGYVLIDNGDNQEVYSLTTNEKVLISDLVLYDLVHDVFGNLAIVSYEGVYKLVNLTTGNLVCSLANSSWEVKGETLLVRANKGEVLKYSSQENANDKFVAVVFNVMSAEVKKEVKDSDNCIEILFNDNFLSLMFENRTEVYVLPAFELLYTYENQSILNSEQYNIQSTFNSSEYFMAVYHRVFKLSDTMLLVEKAEVVSEGADIYIGESNQGYKLTYYMFDLVTEQIFDVETEGEVLRPVETNLGQDYFAVLYHKIENNQISETNVEIKYYLVEENKDNLRSLHLLVSYDYAKNGLICSFNETYLITSGGTDSKPITFFGKENKKIEVIDGSTLEGTNNKSVIIEKTVLGQKRILKLDGKNVVDDVFTRISPFYNNTAIAKNSEGYFRVTTSGDKTEIDNFAQEFEELVFSGIGYYFTTNGQDAYNVYLVDGTCVYENASVNISYDSRTNKALVFIGGSYQKLLEITLKTSNLVVNAEVNNGVYSFSQKQAVKQAIETQISEIYQAEDKAEKESLSVDSEFGYGLLSYALSLKISDLNGKFKSYSDLSNQEKAMIPAFDNTGNLSYISGQTEFMFDGVYFVSGDNFVLALIRLETSGEHTYVINLALNDCYLTNLNVNYNNNALAKMVYGGEVVDAKISSSYRYIPAASLLGVGLTYLDESANMSRTVDYQTVGYDGGLVFAVGAASKINVEFTISNIFAAFDYDTNAVLLDEQTTDFGKFTVKIEQANNVKYALLSAKEGYFITGFKFLTLKEAASTLNAYDVVKEQSVSVLCSNYRINLSEYEGFSAVRFNNVCLVERYSELNFVDYDESVIEKTYFYHGYGEDLGVESNPAYFGFEDFVRRAEVKVPSYRIGYNFMGYNLNETMVVSNEGEFVGELSDLNLDNQSNSVESLVLNAVYEAKKFNVYFTSDGEALAGEEREVSYDSPVGQLPSVSKLGYTLVGWYDEQGKKYNSTTLYQVDNHATLTARWKADVYVLNFDANFASYEQASINGYDYTVRNAQFTSAFNGFRTGDSFSATSKEITYDALYGELPTIMGYSSSDDVYLFLGWFENADPNNKGNEYTNSNLVTISSARTLYAHYTKEIYTVKLEIEGEFKDKLQEIKYAGATSSGSSSTFSTIAGNAENVILLVEDEVILYTLQAKTIDIGVSLLPGYYISEMSVDYAGDTYYFDQSKLTPTQKQFNFTATEDSSGNISVVATNEGAYNLDVSLTMTEGQASSSYDAQIMLVTAETTFTNTISIDATNVDETNWEISNTGIETKTIEKGKSDSVIHNNISAGQQNDYLVDPTFTSITYNGLTCSVATNYLKQLTYKYNGYAYSLDFSTTYEFNSTAQQYILTLTDSKGDFEEVDDFQNDTSTQTFYYGPENCELADAFIRLKVKTNKDTGIMGYELHLGINKNHEVSLTFTDYNASSLVKHVEISGNNDGTNKEETKSLSSVGSAIGGGCRFSLLDNVLLKSVSINYGNKANKTILLNAVGINFGMSVKESSDLSFQCGDTTEDSNKPFSYEYSNTSNTQHYMYLLTTGVGVMYDETVSQIYVLIYGIAKDVTITIETVRYKKIEINASSEIGAGSNNLNLVISTEGQKVFNCGDMSACSTNLRIGDFTSGGVYYRRSSEGDAVNKNLIVLILGSSFQIGGFDDYLTNVTGTDFIVDVHGETMFEIKDLLLTSLNNDTEFENNTLSATIGYNTFESRLEVSGFTRNFEIKVFLGKGNGDYVQDTGNFPNMWGDVLQQTFYYAADSKYFYKDYLHKSFEWGTTTITFGGARSLTGYTLDIEKSGFYNTSNDLVYSIYQVDEHNDISGSGNLAYSETLTYQFTGTNHDEFTFRLYYTPCEYTVKYEVPNVASGGTNIHVDWVDGWMLDDTFTYNVWEQLPECGYDVQGHTFKGYSTSTSGGAVWEASDTLNQNLSDINGDEVTLYCLFDLKQIEVTLNDNVPPGSKLIQSAGGKTEMTINSTYSSYTDYITQPQCYGYTFVGWCFDVAGNNEVGSEVFDGTEGVILYAKWEAVQYAIIYDGNKGSGSTEPNVPDVPSSIYYGNEFSSSAATRDGYTFKGWYTKSEGGICVYNDTNALSFDSTIYEYMGLSVATEQITLYAQWEAVDCIFTIDLSVMSSLVTWMRTESILRADSPVIIGGGVYTDKSSSPTFTIKFDEKITCPTTTVTGYDSCYYTFDEEGNSKVEEGTTTCDGNKTVYLKVGAKAKCEISSSTNNAAVFLKKDNIVENFANKNASIHVDYGDGVIIKITYPNTDFIAMITINSGDRCHTYGFVFNNSTDEIMYGGKSIPKDENTPHSISDFAGYYDSIVVWSNTDGDETYLKLSFVTADIKITDVVVDNKTYQITINKVVDNHVTLLGAVSANMDSTFADVLVPNYNSEQTFVGWFNDAGGSDGVNMSTKISQNYTIYAIYKPSTEEHKVTFHYWDGSEYVARETYDKESSFIDNGRVKKMPSPASEIWPSGTYFAGYIIKLSKPTSYLTTANLEAKSHLSNNEGTLFDKTNLVDSTLNVYAMYNTYKFETTSDGCSINFGEILPDGTVYKFTTEDVSYVYLNDAQKGSYEGNLTNGMSREAALEAVGYSTSSGEYKIAVIFKNPDGSYGNKDKYSYIFAVSDNCVSVFSWW